MSSYRRRLLILVVIVWLAVFLVSNDRLVLLIDYGYFFFVGLLGAVVANSTGAGGGIIFIPFFNALGISQLQTLGTSFAIQCFGMTAGAISWLSASHIVQAKSHHLNVLIKELIIICGLPSILGVLLGQYFLVSDDPTFMVQLFKLFSICFGLILLAILYFNHKQIHTQFDLRNSDKYLLVIVCLVGGVITAWISVGIGEIVAIFLILRHYPTMVAISLGVVMSSVSVLTAIYQHAVIFESLNTSVLMFAVPGALLGGTIAYMLSERLGPTRLKVFFSIWIILTGLFM